MLDTPFPTVLKNSQLLSKETLDGKLFRVLKIWFAMMDGNPSSERKRMEKVPRRKLGYKFHEFENRRNVGVCT
jgi:hypothetical protein